MLVCVSGRFLYHTKYIMPKKSKSFNFKIIGLDKKKLTMLMSFF